MTTVYIVRHAEAQGNVKRLFQGHYDGKISPLGEKQLIFLSEWFTDIHLDAIYASPLTRTRQTAQAVNLHAHLEIQYEPDLIEICGGGFEGKPFSDLSVLFPEAFFKWESDPAHFMAPGGESMQQVYDRMRNAVQRIVQIHPEQTVAIISHGCAIRNFQCYALGFPFERIQEIPFGKNTAISRVDFDKNGIPNVIFLNDATHLPPDMVHPPAFGHTEAIPAQSAQINKKEESK